jgi:hypothetical protein
MVNLSTIVNSLYELLDLIKERELMVGIIPNENQEFAIYGHASLMEGNVVIPCPAKTLKTKYKYPPFRVIGGEYYGLLIPEKPLVITPDIFETSEVYIERTA